MLRLRPYKKSDAKYVARWINDETMYWMWSAGRLGDFPFRPETLNEYYAAEGEKAEFFEMTAIDEDGVPRGQLLMRYPSADTDHVRLGFIVVDNAIRGKGYGKEMLKLVFSYAEHCLHAKRVTLGVFANNPGAIHCYEAAGFKRAAKESNWYEVRGGEMGMSGDGVRYTEINADTIDAWCKVGWEWGQPICHETFERAKAGDWEVVLSPTKPVPKDWFCPMEGAKILGLASGGGQQMPIFTALGAECTILDYSPVQLESERMVAEREGYAINIVRADMTKPLPFENESFDLIFHPISNCYVEDVLPIWKECYRVLKKGGILLAGLDNGLGYLFNDDENEMVRPLPFNPLKDEALYKESIEKGWGIQFSHTIEEQVDGQLRAGFTLTNIFQDTNSEGRLHELNVPMFYVTRAVKQ